MELHTSRLHLREISWDHLEDFFYLHSQPEIDRFNTLGIPANRGITREVLRPAIAAQQLAPRTYYALAIHLQESGAFMGEIGMRLKVARYQAGEIYYNILPECWGKGYATEAAHKLLEFGFQQLRLHRISAGVAVQNLASQKVLEKLGMKKEGHHRKILPIRGEWVDNYSYAMLEEDFFIP
ncbi:MAG: GNAT family N-acetyltransferase [Bacteroidota bacterium]